MDKKKKIKKYVVTEWQLRKLFCMRFAPLDFNTDYVMKFIKEEKLSEVEQYLRKLTEGSV